jgi:YidC/Oxa1 family membrane protein insertase
MGAIWGSFVGFLEWMLLELSILTGSAGIGIILFTIIARLVILPLTLSSVRSSRRMQDLQPQIRELQRKYGKDQAKLSEETIKLYREYKINPAASCLPLFLQLPIFFGVYQAVYHLMIESNHQYLSAGVQAALKDPTVAAILLRPFLGLNLGQAAFGAAGFAGVAYVILPVLSVVLQLVQQIMEMPRVQDPQQKAMSQAMLVMPLVFAYISFTFPMGAVFYWVVGSIIGIIQQYFIAGWGSLVNYLPFLPDRAPTPGAMHATPAAAPDSNVLSSSGSGDVAAAPAKLGFWDALRPLTEEQPAVEAAGAAGANTIVDDAGERANESGRQQSRAAAQRKLRRRR